MRCSSSQRVLTFQSVPLFQLTPRCLSELEYVAVWAGVAQLVEHLICNQRVGGSSPFASSRILSHSKKREFDWREQSAVIPPYRRPLKLERFESPEG